ncbi:MAG: rhodanese-like domain-containing protein [bacterium]
MKKVVTFTFIVFMLGTFGVHAYQDITPAEVHQKVENGDDMVIVDVRELWEYDPAHIIGAINLPWNSRVLQERYEELPMDRDIIVVCRSGNRSAAASTFLDSQGFEHVFNMVGGMLAWEWETVSSRGGWIHRGASDTTFIHCYTDSLDWLEFPPGCMMGMMYPDSIYCEFEEIHPDSMPGTYDSTMIGGYHIDIANPMGHGMMGDGHMGFMQAIRLHLHYDDEMLGVMSEGGMMLKYWDQGTSQWMEVSGVSVNTAENTLTVSQNPLHSDYALFASSVPSKGDVNGDGTVDVLDIVRAVNIILETYQPGPGEEWAADCNGDGEVNILDVVGMVNVILGTGTCPPARNAKIGSAEAAQPFWLMERTKVHLHENIHPEWMR